jgi:hypothetical protein
MLIEEAVKAIAPQNTGERKNGCGILSQILGLLSDTSD